MGAHARPDGPAETAFPSPAVSRETARLNLELTAARENSRRSAERVVEVEQILADSQARAFALEGSLAEQAAVVEDQAHRLDRADRVTSAMKASLSWRITAPLRSLKRRR